MGFVVERARNQHVKIPSPASRRLQPGLRAGRCRILADENGGAFFLVAFKVAAFRANQVARPRGQRGEGDAVFLVRLLDAGRFQIFQNHLRERLRVVVAGFFLPGINQLVVFIYAPARDAATNFPR